MIYQLIMYIFILSFIIYFPVSYIILVFYVFFLRKNNPELINKFGDIPPFLATISQISALRCYLRSKDYLPSNDITLIKFSSILRVSYEYSGSALLLSSLSLVGYKVLFEMA